MNTVTIEIQDTDQYMLKTVLYTASDSEEEYIIPYTVSPLDRYRGGLCGGLCSGLCSGRFPPFKSKKYRQSIRYVVKAHAKKGAM